MKRIVILFALLSVICNSSFGQWYYDKYYVRDIDSLSLDQLEESLDKAKNDLRVGGIVTLCGGLIVGGGFLTLYSGLPEDPTFLEELLGSEVMGKVYIIAGTGVAAAGVIICLSELGRVGQIKNVINRNYPAESSLYIRPVLIPDSYYSSVVPGVALTIKF